MKRRNRTKAALLGFLSWGPMSGYDLRRVIDQSISNFWSESYGRIYPMLAELSKDGLVDCQKTVSDGGRPRNVYKLTKECCHKLCMVVLLSSQTSNHFNLRTRNLNVNGRHSDVPKDFDAMDAQTPLACIYNDFRIIGFNAAF